MFSSTLCHAAAGTTYNNCQGHTEFTASSQVYGPAIILLPTCCKPRLRNTPKPETYLIFSSSSLQFTAIAVEKKSASLLRTEISSR